LEQILRTGRRQGNVCAEQNGDGRNRGSHALSQKAQALHEPDDSIPTVTAIASVRPFPVPVERQSTGLRTIAGATPRPSRALIQDPSPINFPNDIFVARFLRALHVQLRSIRLYQRNHPRVAESLETTERELRAAFSRFPAFGIRIERGALLLEAGEPGTSRALMDPRGELRSLAEQLNRAGIAQVEFLPKTNLGELTLFAQAVDATDRLAERAPGVANLRGATGKRGSRNTILREFA
jgi:hypothetical protein